MAFFHKFARIPLNMIPLEEFLSQVSELFLAEIYLRKGKGRIFLGLFGNDGKGTYVQIRERHFNTGYYFMKDGKIHKKFLSIANTIVEEETDEEISPMATINLFKGLGPEMFQEGEQGFFLPFQNIVLYDIPFRLSILVDIPLWVEGKEFLSFRLLEEEGSIFLEYSTPSTSNGEKNVLLFRFLSFGKGTLLPKILPRSDKEDSLLRQSLIRIQSSPLRCEEHIIDMTTGKEMGSGYPVPLEGYRVPFLSSVFFQKQEMQGKWAFVFDASRYGNLLPAKTIDGKSGGNVLQLMILMDDEELVFLYHLFEEGENIRHILVFCQTN